MCFVSASLFAMFAPGSKLGVAYRKMMRLHDSFSYLGRNSSHVAKHPWIEMWCNGLTASCQAAATLCAGCLVCLSVSTNQKRPIASRSASQHPSGPCSPRSPGMAEEASNEIDLTAETRHKPALQDPPQLAGTCALANVTSSMLGTFYHHSSGYSPELLPKAAPSAGAPGRGAPLFSTAYRRNKPARLQRNGASTVSPLAALKSY